MNECGRGEGEPNSIERQERRAGVAQCRVLAAMELWSKLSWSRRKIVEGLEIFGNGPLGAILACVVGLRCDLLVKRG